MKASFLLLLSLLLLLFMGCQSCERPFDISIESSGECARLGLDFNREQTVDLRNTTKTTWHDVEIKVTVVDGSKREIVTDEVFVGEWRAEERICVQIMRDYVEKLEVKLKFKQSWRSHNFAFYELPKIPERPELIGIPPYARELIPKEARRNFFEMRSDLFSTLSNEEQRTLAWERKWRNQEVIVPACSLTEISRRHVKCELLTDMGSKEGSLLSADLSGELADDEYLAKTVGTTCMVRGTIVEQPNVVAPSGYSCGSGSNLCLSLNLRGAHIEC